MTLPRFGSRVVDFFSQVGGRSQVRAASVPENSRRSRSTDAGQYGSPPCRENYLVGKSSESVLDRRPTPSGFTESKRVFFTGVEESKESENEKEEHLTSDLTPLWSDSEEKLRSRENSFSELSDTFNNNSKVKLAHSEGVINTETHEKKSQLQLNILTDEFPVPKDTATNQLTEPRFGFIGNAKVCKETVGESWYRERAISTVHGDGKCDEEDEKNVLQDSAGRGDAEINMLRNTAPLCIEDSPDLIPPWNLQSKVDFFSVDQEEVRVAEDVKKKASRNEFDTLTEEFPVPCDAAAGQLTESRFGFIGNAKVCKEVVGESWYRERAINVLGRKCDEEDMKNIQQASGGKEDNKEDNVFETLISAPLCIKGGKEDNEFETLISAPLCIKDSPDLTSPWNLQSKIPFFSTDHAELSLATELTFKLDSIAPPLQTSLSDFSLLMDSKFDDLSSLSQMKFQKSYTIQTVHKKQKQKIFVAPSGPSLKGGLPFSILLNQHQTTGHKLPSPGNIQKRVYTNDKRRLSVEAHVPLNDKVNSEEVLEGVDSEEQSKTSQNKNSDSPNTSA